MHFTRLSTAAFTIALLTAISLTGCMNINQDVVIADEETVSSSKSTINGAIRVGSNAEVRGSLSTVNGNARIGENAHVESVQTVNGRITLAAGARAENLLTVNGTVSLAQEAHVSGKVETTNGAITLDSGARVEGTISAINGKITLDGAEAGELVNYNGGMILKNGSVVHGELTVHAPHDSDRAAPPVIIIGHDCRVIGSLTFDRQVELHVHETAEIGPVRGAEPIEYSGDEPQS